MQNEDCGTSAITSSKLAKTDKLYSRDTLWYWNCWGVCIRDAYEMPHAHMYTCNLVGCLISVPDWNDQKLCFFPWKTVPFIKNSRFRFGTCKSVVSFLGSIPIETSWMNIRQTIKHTSWKDQHSGKLIWKTTTRELQHFQPSTIINCNLSAPSAVGAQMAHIRPDP